MILFQHWIDNLPENCINFLVAPEKWKPEYGVRWDGKINGVRN
jgi:hypothetical protein